MHTALRMRQYQQQAVASASPEQLVIKLYDLGIAACHRDDRSKVRRVLAELMGALDTERGGEIAQRLFALYDFMMAESASGDINAIAELLTALRDAWRQSLDAARQAA